MQRHLSAQAQRQRQSQQRPPLQLPTDLQRGLQLLLDGLEWQERQADELGREAATDIHQVDGGYISDSTDCSARAQAIPCATAETAAVAGPGADATWSRGGSLQIGLRPGPGRGHGALPPREVLGSSDRESHLFGQDSRSGLAPSDASLDPGGWAHRTLGREQWGRELQRQLQQQQLQQRYELDEEAPTQRRQLQWRAQQYPQQSAALCLKSQQPTDAQEQPDGPMRWEAQQDGGAAVPPFRRQRQEPSGLAMYVSDYVMDDRGGSQAARIKRRRTETDDSGASAEPSGGGAVPHAGGNLPGQPPPLIRPAGDVGVPQAVPMAPFPCAASRGARSGAAFPPGVAAAMQPQLRRPPLLLPAAGTAGSDTDGSARYAVSGWGAVVVRGGGARHPTFGRTPAHEWPTGRAGPWDEPSLYSAGQHRRPQRFRKMSDLLLLPEVKLEPRSDPSSDAEGEEEGEDGAASSGGEDGEAKEPAAASLAAAAAEAKEPAAGSLAAAAAEAVAAGGAPQTSAGACTVSEAGAAPVGPGAATATAPAAATQRAARRGTHISVVQKGCNQVKVPIPSARHLFAEVLPSLGSRAGQPIEIYLARPPPCAEARRQAGPQAQLEPDDSGTDAAGRGGRGGLRLQRLRGVRLVGCGVAWALTGLRGMVRALGLANCEKALLIALPASQRHHGGAGDGDGGEEDLPGVIVSRMTAAEDLAAAGDGKAMWAHNYNGLLTVPATLTERLFPAVVASGREATLPVRAAARLAGEPEPIAYPGVCLRGLFRRVVLSGLGPALRQMGLQAGDSLALWKEPDGRVVLARPEDAAAAAGAPAPIGRGRAGADDSDGTHAGAEPGLAAAPRGRTGRRVFAPDISDSEDAGVGAAELADAGSLRDGGENASGSEDGSGDARNGGAAGGHHLRRPRRESWQGSRGRTAVRAGDGAPEVSAAGTPGAAAAARGGGGGAQPAPRVRSSELLAMPPLLSPVAAAATAAEAVAVAAAAITARDAVPARSRKPQPQLRSEVNSHPPSPSVASAAAAGAGCSRGASGGQCAAGANVYAAGSVVVPFERLVFLEGRGGGGGPPCAISFYGATADHARCQRGASAPDLPADTSAVGDEYDRGYYSGYQDGYQDGYEDGVEDAEVVSGPAGGRGRVGGDGPSSGANARAWEYFTAEGAEEGWIPGDQGSGRGFRATAAAPPPIPGGAGGAAMVPFVSLFSSSTAATTARTGAGATAPPPVIRVVQLPSGRPRARVGEAGEASVRPAARLPQASYQQPQEQQQESLPLPLHKYSSRPRPTDARAAAWAAGEADGRAAPLPEQWRLLVELARGDGSDLPRPVRDHLYAAQSATVAARHDAAGRNRSPLHPGGEALRHALVPLRSPLPLPAAAATVARQQLNLELLLGLGAQPPRGGGGGVASRSVPHQQWVAVPVPVVEAAQGLPADSLCAARLVRQGQPQRLQQAREDAPARKRPHADEECDMGVIVDDVRERERGAAGPATARVAKDGSPLMRLRRPAAAASRLAAAAAAAAPERVAEGEEFVSLRVPGAGTTHGSVPEAEAAGAAAEEEGFAFLPVRVRADAGDWR